MHHAATHRNTLMACILHHPATQHNVVPCRCRAASLSLVYMQHTATHCNTLQHTATHCSTLMACILHHTAPHCNTLQHTATHCNTLLVIVVLPRSVLHIYATRQHTAAPRQHTATHSNTQQHTATHCHTLQHIATHCTILQHNALLESWCFPLLDGIPENLSLCLSLFL